MQVVVIADGITQTEFQDKQIPAGIRVEFVATIDEIIGGADAFFYLLEEETFLEDVEKIEKLGSPVFMHAVSTTLERLPSNAIRICGWRGFLLQETIEICTRPGNIAAASRVLNGLQWRYQPVPDIVGLIAPRTTALLINEAYLIISDEPSQKGEIDSAMKLAANFRSGPFELAEKIGLKKIFNLLTHLAGADARYNPAPLLQKEISDLGSSSKY
jgi:3-hydroxybutyryl-CoA dehydrogenase